MLLLHGCNFHTMWKRNFPPGGIMEIFFSTEEDMAVFPYCSVGEGGLGVERMSSVEGVYYDLGQIPAKK